MQALVQKLITWQRSPLYRFCGWLFSWRILKHWLFALAVLVTLIVLVYTVENWRGSRAWTQYKRQLETQGERLDWTAFIPPPVSDDKNFAATPFLDLVCTQSPNSPELKKRWPTVFEQARSEEASIQKMSKSGRSMSPERKMTDLQAWAAAFVKVRTRKLEFAEGLPSDPAARAKAAAAVLENLKVYDSVLDELRQVSPRPGCRFKIRYEEDNPLAIQLRHLPSIKGICSLLKVRAAAELALGQADPAYQDLQLMLRLVDAMKNEPMLISYLVGVAMFRLSTDLIWEGLAQRQWSDAQLEQLQARLQQYDFVAGIHWTLRAERAYGLKFMEFLRNRSDRGQVLYDIEAFDGVKALANLYNALPRGWLYFEQYNYARLFQEDALANINPEPKLIDPARWRTGERKLNEDLSRRGLSALLNHTILASLLLPAVTRAESRGAEAQCIAQEAALACALERCRRADGQFPDKLEALVPRFTPKPVQDVITGGPMLYRRTDNGQFLLYSVGWDGKDDGGVVPAKPTAGAPQDWVWRYPAQ